MLSATVAFVHLPWMNCLSMLSHSPLNQNKRQTHSCKANPLIISQLSQWALISRSIYYNFHYLPSSMEMSFIPYYVIRGCECIGACEEF